MKPRPKTKTCEHCPKRISIKYKICHFILDEGMDRSRDREIQTLKIELAGISTKVSQVRFTQKLIHFWNPKRWLFTGF